MDARGPVRIPLQEQLEVSVEAESFLIVITAPIWFTAFVILFIAGYINDRKNHVSLR